MLIALISCEVGARSGVSRSAAYRHFADKESLLNELATNALSELGDVLEVLAAGDDLPEQFGWQRLVTGEITALAIVDGYA